MSDIIERMQDTVGSVKRPVSSEMLKEVAAEILRLRAEKEKLAQLRAALSEAYDKGRGSRGEVVAAGHALFVYAQKVAHKIKRHSLEKLIPLPDDELLAFIRAVDESSKSERARAAAAAILEGEKNE